METLRYIAGLMAAGLSCAGGIIYIRAIWRRDSTTRWSSWLIWTITSFTSLATYYGSGARESIWVNVAYVGTCTTTLAVALRRRSPGSIAKVEIACLLGAALACVVWWGSGSAVWGQVVSVAIEVVGYVPIWLAARDENKAGWMIESTGSVINMLAISQFAFGLLLYPSVILFCNAFVVTLIFWSARRIEKQAVAELVAEPLDEPALEV